MNNKNYTIFFMSFIYTFNAGSSYKKESPPSFMYQGKMRNYLVLKQFKENIS